jgi:hypothetical protein
MAGAGGGAGAAGAGAGAAASGAAGAGAGAAGAGAAGGVAWAVSAAGAGPLLHPPRSSKPAKDKVLSRTWAAGRRAGPRLVRAALEKACLIIVLSLNAKFMLCGARPSCPVPATFGLGDPRSVSLDRSYSRPGPARLASQEEPWPCIRWRLLKNDLSLHQLATTLSMLDNAGARQARSRASTNEPTVGAPGLGTHWPGKPGARTATALAYIKCAAGRGKPRQTKSSKRNPVTKLGIEAAGSDQDGLSLGSFQPAAQAASEFGHQFQFAG